MVIRTHKEINILIWVIALSVGFWHGGFTLQSFGGIEYGALGEASLKKTTLGGSPPHGATTFFTY